MKRVTTMLIMILAIAGCKCENKKSFETTTKVSAAKVQVLLFHAAQRCATCRAIEAVTKEVLYSDFAKQVDEGKLAFRDIDGSLKENQSLVDKYEVISTSIFIDNDGIVVNITNDAFTYVRTNPERFKKTLRKELTKALR